MDETQGTPDLGRLIAEATVLAGGQHQCAVLGHLWSVEGGRACPRGCTETQPVYQCASCGAWDYGNPGGPGHHHCFQAAWRRCDGTDDDHEDQQG